VCAASWTFPSLFVARRGKHSGEKLRHRRGDFARLACALCVRTTASRGADLRVAAVSVSQTAAGLSRMLRFGKVQSCTSAGSYFSGRRWIDGVERFRSTDHESCRRELSAVKEMARKRCETCLESAKNYLNCGDVQNAKATAIEGRRCGPRFLLPGGTGAVWTN